MADAKLPKAWTSWRSISKTDPKRLVKLVAAAIELRDKRKSLEDEAAVYGKEESEIKKYLIDNFRKDELTEVKTSAGVAKLVPKQVPQMDTETGGWPAIFAYIAETGSFDLFQKRLMEAACKERWAAGIKIPGVKEFNTWVLKLGDAE